MANGERMTFAELIEALDPVRVIYVGERHDALSDHRVEHAVIEALHARDASMAIGMEMFQRPFQSAIDAYLSGAKDESELLRETEWDERWGFDFGFYRPILELARAEGLSVIALNARRELTRTIARDGEETLSAELRSELPEIDRDNAEHRAMIMNAFGEHPNLDPVRLERFYTAQLVWDETMAEEVARVLASPDAPRRMVVLAGRMHVQAGLGIPTRAARRGAEPYRVLLAIDPEEIEEVSGACDYAIIAR